MNKGFFQQQKDPNISTAFQISSGLACIYKLQKSNSSHFKLTFQEMGATRPLWSKKFLLQGS